MGSKVLQARRTLREVERIADRATRESVVAEELADIELDRFERLGPNDVTHARVQDVHVRAGRVLEHHERLVLGVDDPIIGHTPCAWSVRCF